MDDALLLLLLLRECLDEGKQVLQMAILLQHDNDRTVQSSVVKPVCNVELED